MPSDNRLIPAFSPSPLPFLLSVFLFTTEFPGVKRRLTE
jgi:hypothetical protein